MAIKKMGHLGSEIALFQHGFANESVADLYNVCRPASFSDARREIGNWTVSLAIFFTKRSGL
jgi:hypothetical protein